MSRIRLEEAHARTVEWQAAFIQGVAVSAIGFSIHETSDRSYSASLIPIGVAIVCWGLSFYFGIQHNHARQKAIAANIGSFVAVEMGREDLQNHANELFKQHSRKSGKNYLTQLYLILAGAVLYVFGHGLHIWENQRTATYQVTKPTSALPPGTPAALRP